MSRFLIIASARTGSNLLVRLLNNPPTVRCFGEVGKEQFPIDTHGFALISKLSGLPVEALSEAHTRNIAAFVYDILYAIRARSVGFKIFYEHCRSPNRSAIWNRLAADRELRIVHLQRRNPFDLYLSVLYAKRTGAWLQTAATGNARNDQEDIEVDPESCKAYLEWYLRARDETRSVFGGHPMIDVDYETFAQDIDVTMGRVCAFLDIPPRASWTAPLVKQAGRPASEKVANYAALQRAFEGTSLAEFFP